MTIVFFLGDKMRAVIFIIIMLMPGISSAEWTKTDTAYQLAYTTVHVVDWGQTRDIAIDPNAVEANPILGQYPTTNEVDIYFATTLIGHTAISYFLPDKYRRWWQGVWIALEAGTVMHNYSAGISVNFK